MQGDKNHGAYTVALALTAIDDLVPDDFSVAAADLFAYIGDGPDTEDELKRPSWLSIILRSKHGCC